MNDEMTAVCKRCGARLTLPLPDVVSTDDGDLERSVDLTNTDARESLREFLEAYPCPSCEYISLRVPVD